jgi:hypothetical protein
MRTTFDWRRGLFYAVLIGGGAALAISAGMFFANSPELPWMPLIALSHAATWGGIAFVLMAVKPAGTTTTVLKRPTVVEWFVEMLWRTMAGFFVAIVGATVVELAVVGMMYTVYGSVVPPPSAFDSWESLIGFCSDLAALAGAFVGAMTGAWMSRGQLLATSIGGSVFGACLGAASGAVMMISMNGGWPSILYVGIGSGAISGVAGAIFARTFLPPVPTDPIPAELSTAIEVRRGRNGVD